MSMILHELATNAAKYGALSVEDGRIEIAWRAEPGGGLRLTWREHDGPPPPKALAATGFGSRLITELSRQLGGEASRDWTPTGLSFELAWTPAPDGGERSAEDEALAALQLAGH
jgi:two-component sensor histidine kinase